MSDSKNRSECSVTSFELFEILFNCSKDLIYENISDVFLCKIFHTSDYLNKCGYENELSTFVLLMFS